MYCTKCGWENPQGAKFCRNCGSELKETESNNESVIVDSVKTDSNYNNNFKADNESDDSTDYDIPLYSEESSDDSFKDCCCCIGVIFVIALIIMMI